MGIYLREFTNNVREIPIPHEAAECGVENFEFIVSEHTANKKSSNFESAETIV